MSTKARNGLPKTANGRNHPLTITTMAEEAAHLRRIASKMDEAHMVQRGLLKDIPQGVPCRIVPFEAIRGEADTRARALEEMILTCEPDSMDEALSLALIMLGDLDAVVDKEGEVQDTFTALAALARWMIRAGATTPLRKEYYACGYLKPRAQEIEEALARADEMAKHPAMLRAKPKAINAQA